MMNKKEFAKSLDCNIADLDLVKIAESNDYKTAYEDYVNFEKSYEDEEITKQIVSFEKFRNEINKGYGKSEILQIARLVVLDDGIYYDNEFCF